MTKVLHIVLNNFKNDSRVLKECNSINSKLNIDVIAFALHEEGLKVDEEKDSLNIKRFKLKTRGWPKVKPVQLIKYFECWYRMYQQATVLKPDIVHAHDLSALPIGATIAQKLNIPLIYDAHEYETEKNGIKSGSLWQKGLTFVERNYIKRANKVITVSEGIAREYVKNYNIFKPALIKNCPYLQTANKHDDLLRKEFGIPNHHLVFIYQGGLSPGRGLPQLLEAFKNLKDKSKHFVVMGYGVLEPIVKEYESENYNIHLKEAVKPEEIVMWTSSADIGISTIENTCLSYYYCLPNKIFEYLMADIPIIVSDLFELRKLVESYDVGWVVEENTKEEIQNIVEQIKIEDLDSFKQGIKNAVKEFNWQEQEKVLVGLYKELL